MTQGQLNLRTEGGFYFPKKLAEVFLKFVRLGFPITDVKNWVDGGNGKWVAKAILFQAGARAFELVEEYKMREGLTEKWWRMPGEALPLIYQGEEGRAVQTSGLPKRAFGDFIFALEHILATQGFSANVVLFELGLRVDPIAYATVLYKGEPFFVFGYVPGYKNPDEKTSWEVD